MTEGVLRSPAEPPPGSPAQPVGTPSVSLRLTTPSEREPLEAVYGTWFTPSITLAGAGFPIDKPPPVWYNRLKDGAGPGMALIIAFPPPPRKRRGRRLFAVRTLPPVTGGVEDVL